MIVYGRNPVREALRGRREVAVLYADARAAREGWLADAGVPIEVLPDDAALSDLCQSSGHQGVCARVAAYPYAEAADLLSAEEALVIVLDEVQDPQNLGAVCRVAECAGARGVVIPERRSATVTPAVCKASAGAVEHLPVARVRNVTEFLNLAKKAGAWVYGAHAGRTPYDRPDYRGRVVLVLGSEGRGLRPRVLGACDELVSLPVRGRVESLNVSTAAAALVYGILHSRTAALDKAP